MDLYKEKDRKFRPEIEGLRAIAAILVAVYHIWLGNVSGGVDVFFVVSGFLITASLLSRYERTGHIEVIGYLLKLGKRLFPAAFTVLLFVLVTSFLFFPQTQWVEIIKEIVASMIYLENWQLATNSVNYLAQNNVSSPVQHFWAMSTQFQFYFIWTFVLLLAVFIAKNINVKPRIPLMFILITIFITSFVYSIYITKVNQPWAYFDTFARVWEFAAGGLLFLIIANITLSKNSGFIIGWVGLIGLISCGLILQVSTVFPGYAALWPVLSAVFVLIAGNSGGKYSAYQLLSSKPLVRFGGISYGFYLWHWPLLILYFNITGNDTVSVTNGLLIILLSVILSYFTTKLIENPIKNKKVTSKTRTALLLLVVAAPILILSGIWTWHIKESQADVINTEIIDKESYPGAEALMTDNEIESQDSYYPQLIQVSKDLPKSYYDGCHQGSVEAEVIVCEYGEIEKYNKTIALVGGSHSAHWLPPLEIFGEREKVKILNITKSGCRFSTDNYKLSTDLSQRTCEEWNEELMDKLIETKPDLIFTTADATEWDGIPEGYVDKWRELEKHNIKIFAIKDNPRANFDIPTCIAINGIHSEKCMIENNFEDLSREISNLDLTNIYYADLTDKFCEKDKCKPIVGNIIVYKDSDHITSTYAKTLVPYLTKELNGALDYFYD